MKGVGHEKGEDVEGWGGGLKKPKTAHYNRFPSTDLSPGRTHSTLFYLGNQKPMGIHLCQGWLLGLDWFSRQRLRNS